MSLMQFLNDMPNPDFDPVAYFNQARIKAEDERAERLRAGKKMFNFTRRNKVPMDIVKEMDED